MRLIAVALAAVFTAGSALAADKPTSFTAEALQTAAQLREQALQDDVAYEVVAGLSIEVGARLAGSEADQRGRDWMVAKFKALGFDKVWTEPVTYPKWVRRSESASLVSPYPHDLAITALGNSSATPAGGLTAEVVAFASLDALKTASAGSVRGKIVYIGAQHMHASVEGRDYGKGSAIRTGGPSIASEKGAAAFVLRSVGSDNNRTPHTGMTRFADGVSAIPAAAVSNPDADLIDAILAQGKPMTMKLSLDVGADGEYTGANVIAEMSGRDKKSKAYFLTGGHLDSWDLGQGSIDDGAGVAIATAAAHLIGHLPQRPRRSIRVVAFANEESGLFGGKAYGEAHRADIANAVLGTESDAGADRIVKISASVKPSARAAVDAIAELLKPLGIEYDAKAPGAGGSDLSAVHAVGMAGLSLHQDTTRYFDWHHTSNDTLDKVDPEQLRQNVAAYVVVAYLAAEADGDFGSKPGAFAKDGDEH
ncbi:MAG: M20/M25/M40 family metallo-hydrolase [Dokdonella sp.]